MLFLDHIAVACTDLAEGAAAVEAALGVALAPGGQHPAMGTHNRLLSLGPGVYLEVIATDPAAPPPGRPRWFDLDRFAGPPRLTNWIVRCDDLDREVGRSPAGTGQPMDFARGDFRWRMAVPEDGRLPFGGAFPALIAWAGNLHPSDRLADIGCRLKRLTVLHPEAEAVQAALAGRVDDPRLEIAAAPAPGLRAEIVTPHGTRTVG